MQNLNANATQPEINQTTLKGLEVILPKKDSLEKFNAFAEPLVRNIFNYAIQNQHLRESRDILLPRLMMGLVDSEEILG